MKKIFMTLLAINAAGLCYQSAFADNSSTVTLNFSATITAELCQVDASATTLKYDFGNVIAYQNAKDGDPVIGVTPQSNNIKLDCASDPTGKLKISFTSPSSTLEGTTLLPLKNGANDSGVGVELYDASTAKNNPLDLTGTAINEAAGTWDGTSTYSFPLTAQLVYDSNVANLTPGTATANIVLDETSA